MSANDHWMPLYIGDYLADTMHLGALEHGAYLLLIMAYWRTGPLPNNEETLAAIARVDRRTWRNSVAPKVLPFFTIGDAFLQHKRVDLELERVANLSEKRREAANARHSKRTQKPKGNGGGGDANAEQMHSKSSANGQHLECYPHPQLEKGESPRAREESVPPARAHAHARPLPEDWQPSAEGLRFAGGLGLDPAAVAEGFRNHRLANAITRADFDADFRWWCQREARDHAPKRSGSPPSDRRVVTVATASTKAVLDMIDARFDEAEAEAAQVAARGLLQ